MNAENLNPTESLKEYLGDTYNENDHTFNLESAKKQELNEKRFTNIIIMGASGAGKSSLINYIFGDNVAETGSGTPITQSLSKIPIAQKSITLWDTKGIEVKDYEGTKNQLLNDIDNAIQEALKTADLNKFPHLAWLCIKESSHRIEEWVFDLMEKMKKYHIPTIIVFTNYSKTKGNNDFFIEAKNIINQRYYDFIKNRFFRINSVSEYNEEFEAHTQKFGAEELVKHIEECIDDIYLGIEIHLQKDLERRKEAEERRKSFIRAQKANNKKRLNAMIDSAKTAVHIASAAAGTAGASPIPGSDAPIIAAIQAKMIHSINDRFELDLSNNLITSIITGILGVTAIAQVGKTVVSSVLKFIPVVGTITGGAISATTAVAITEAIGHAYIAVLESCYDMETGQVELPDGTDEILELFKQFFVKP